MICSAVSLILPLAWAIVEMSWPRSPRSRVSSRLSEVTRVIGTRFFFHSCSTPVSSSWISSISSRLGGGLELGAVDLLLQLRDALLELRLLAGAGLAPGLEQLALAADEVARPPVSSSATVRSAGKETCFAPSRSASSRPWRAASSSRLLETIARLARATVSSRRITTSPARTRSPSRARISPTTPPVGCWTFLTWLSTTTCPGATTAPESRSSPPSRRGRPTRKERRPARAQRVWRRIELRALGLYRSFMTLLPDLKQTWRVYGAHVLGALPAGTGRRTLLSTSSLGRTCTRPSPITSTSRRRQGRSGRWAMTTTMPPRARTPWIARGQRLLALVVEVGVRLVEHDQERVAVERPGEARCAGADRRTGRRRPRRPASRSPPAGAGSSRGRRPPWPPR